MRRVIKAAIAAAVLVGMFGFLDPCEWFSPGSYWYCYFGCAECEAGGGGGSGAGLP